VLVIIESALLLAVTPAPPVTTVSILEGISSQDYEGACKQPVAIMTVVSMVVMIPIKFMAMFALFTKLDGSFNPERIRAIQRRKSFVQRLTGIR
jgi:hypothetical protein